ncbi:CPCC family cysteine-rich protein [Hymenobacter artigasi]|uniref:CPCC family cysteine-rich protein n=1 Tax=Hymenobacter artigasi TaxID=2719616 RepID=UPI001447AFF5|nr:CPCC family cysteine-rich protein [Hymenobacter artigasi]
MKANRFGNYPCPCCGFYTLAVPPDGSFDICPVCFWEDDYVQLNDPTYTGGANKLSLEHSRIQFAQYGACEHRFKQLVRPPLPDELPD